MRKETTEILKKYIGDMLEKYEINIAHAVFSLEYTFGAKIHSNIQNFIEFAKENNINDDDIAITLAHDVGGALRNDTLMLPRVSGY